MNFRKSDVIRSFMSRCPSTSRIQNGAVYTPVATMSSSQGPPSASLRLPAPYLFVGPPSQGPARPGLRDASGSSAQVQQRQRSGLKDSSPSRLAENETASNGDVSTLKLANATPMDPSPLQQQQDDRTEAIWAEMQHTLEEVELTAANGLNNVFGPDHARALADLRAAQVRLAEAWGRSEADDETGEDAVTPGMPPDADRGNLGGTQGVLEKDRSEKMGMQPGTGEAGKGKTGKTQLEEDTDNDILLARERREANDRYFERVNKGVVDVVAQLDEVAARMKAVENESKEIWNERDSSDGDGSG